MKTIKNIFSLLIGLISYLLAPLKKVCEAIYRVLNSLAQLIETPSLTVQAVSNRARNKAASLEGELEKKSTARYDRKEDKELNSQVDTLFKSRNFLEDFHFAAWIKASFILLLESVSCFTTYRGLFQCFEALHPSIPLILTIVIQGGIVYLSHTVSFSHSYKGRRFLLVFLLCISISLSFVGICETVTPYANHVERKYSEYYSVYMESYNDMRLNSRQGQGVDGKIEGQYQAMEQLIGLALQKYGDQAQATVQAQINDLEGRTITMEKQNPTYYTWDWYGNVLTYGGGTELETVPDPEAVQPLNEAKSNLAQMAINQERVENLQEMIDQYGPEAVKNAITRQADSGSVVLSEEMMMLNQKLAYVTSEFKWLSQDLGLDLIVSLDVVELYEEYNTVNHFEKLILPAEFSQILSEWQKERVEPWETGIGFFDGIMKAAVSSVPLKLKQESDAQVTASYQSLRQELKISGLADSEWRLGEAFEAYSVIHPMLYPFLQLGQTTDFSQNSMLALLIAIINDGLAVLIGFFLEKPSLDLTKRKKFSSSDLLPYIYPMMVDAIRPILLRKMREYGETVCGKAIHDLTREILEEAFHSFTLCVSLIPEGFCRYMRAGMEDSDLEAIVSVLAQVGMIREVTGTEFNALTNMSIGGDDDRFLLLTNRGEEFLRQLIGSVSYLPIEIPQLTQ